MKLPSSAEEGMPRPTAPAGVVGCGLHATAWKVATDSNHPSGSHWLPPPLLIQGGESLAALHPRCPADLWDMLSLLGRSQGVVPENKKAT